MTQTDIEVVDDDAKHRYEARTDDGTVLGFATYRLSGDTVVFVHTEVADEAEGEGIGSRLVRGALDDVRRQGKQMRPDCPFVKAYVEEHPEYQDLVVGQ
jgi:predicted GNAT family acetyltransferase